MKAVILSAGIGERLREYTDQPKCLLTIGGETLLHRYFRVLELVGISDIVLVTGYRHDAIINELKTINFSGALKIIYNPYYEHGSMLSLWSAKEELVGDTLIMDADVYFEDTLIKRVCSSKKCCFFLLDTTSFNDGEAVMVGFNKGNAISLARGLKGEFSVLGEMVGFTRLSDGATNRLVTLLEQKVMEGEKKMGYELLFPQLFKDWPMSYEIVNGLKWVEIDFPEDVKKAQSIASNL